MTISGCAGGVTAQGGGEESGSGFSFGAAQEEVDAAVADLEPVTITYQPTTSGPNSTSAHVDTSFADEIEERSNGKITVEIAWAQAIAGYDDIDDALADGRLDIGRTIPSYHPQQYPAFSAIDTMLANLESSPHVSEVAANAVGLELGWGSEKLMAEYEDKQLTPIIPVFAQAGNYMACSQPGTSAEDFEGRQIRVASAAISDQVTAMGATPVSMDYPEIYEGLQRGTIDCTVGKLASLAETGVLEVAPHLSYPSTVSYAKAPSAIVFGRNVSQLPLAYQQIIFDAQIAFFAASMQESVGNAIGIRSALEHDGEVQQFSEEVDTKIAGANKDLVAEIESSGVLGDDPLTTLTDAESKWTAAAKESGIADDGEFANLPEWYDSSINYRPFAEKVYQDLAEPHRPSQE
nr:C4-dicarboxylate ABC transporter substrate-binding protein [Brevibacterium daeguense]